MIRKLFSELYAHAEKKQFTILTGARQVGKTTLLRQLQEALSREGRPTVYLTLEYTEVLTRLNESPLNLLGYLPRAEGRIYVFLDEIQYLKDPTNFMKLLFDEYADRVKLIVTGSSAFYMDEKFRDSLAGRKKLFFLPPCSFEETLELSGKGELLSEYRRVLADDGALTVSLPLLKRELEQYMIYGGYPAVAAEQDPAEKRELLRELRDSFLKRDIREAGVEHTDGFYKVLKLLAAQSGSLLNVTEVAGTLGLPRSEVEKDIAIMEKCFHIRLVRPFYANVRKELTKMPKVYLMDTGMRNSLLNYFPEQTGLGDNGALFEMTVFRSLMEHHRMDDIYYWRTADQKEVDFVLPDADHPFALEVKYSASAVRQKKYVAFTEAYPHIPLQYRTLEPFTEDTLRELWR